MSYGKSLDKDSDARTCWCFNYLSENPDRVLKNTNNLASFTVQCEEGLKLYLLSSVLPAVMGILIALLNVILDVVIKGMATFRRPKT